jgi:broad specificity phosphatase PhoE
MPAIYLVRHGQASFGSENYDVLSPTGQLQASIVGKELVRRGVRAPIFGCGTLSRQRETATIAAVEFGVARPEFVVDSRWNEFDAHGLVDRWLDTPGISTSMTSSEFQIHLDKAFTAWIEGTDGSWDEFSSGAFGALVDFIAQIPRGSDGIVVTSAGVTAAVAGRFFSTDAAGVVALNRVGINTAITSILSGSSGLNLLTFNDHAHVIGCEGMLTTR